MKTLLLLCLLFSSFAHADELKLMTWNVFMLPKPIKNSFQKKRTAMIIEELKKTDSDVILFQEAFSGRFRKHVKRDLSEKFPHQFNLKKKFFPLVALGPGLMVISRYPFKVLGKTYFKDCRTFDCYATKGAFLIEVTLPSGRTVQISNTHLQSGQVQESKDIRVTQLQQIQELLDAHKKENVPQILGGDINVNSANEEFAQSQSILKMESVPLPFVEKLESEIVSFVPRKDTLTFYSAGFKLECYEHREANLKLIDHVLHRPNGTTLAFEDDRIIKYQGLINDKSCPLSDHHARQVNVKIN